MYFRPKRRALPLRPLPALRPGHRCVFSPPPLQRFLRKPLMKSMRTGLRRKLLLSIINAKGIRPSALMQIKKIYGTKTYSEVPEKARRTAKPRTAVKSRDEQTPYGGIVRVR